MLNLFKRSTGDLHFHKDIWKEMIAGTKRENRLLALTQSQIRRIEERLFTEEENTTFYAEEAIKAVANRIKDGFDD